MYGVFYGGGTNGGGCFYSLTTNGVFSPLLHFYYPTGGAPVGGPIWSPDGNFYCLGRAGGLGNGVVIKISPTNSMSPAWTGKIIASFDNTGNGSGPDAGLTLGSDGKFYGVTSGGGDTGWGEFYSLPATGAPITGLASFNNADGISPQAGLTLAPDGCFYGTAYTGGSGNAGTLFRLATNGVFTRLVTFGSTNGIYLPTPLCLGPDGKLYGAANAGGQNGSGTIFSITTNGGFAKVFDFNYNLNGTAPIGGLALGPDGNLYGTTSNGGTNGGAGTIFRYNTNGTLATIFTFATTNGASPRGTLFWNTDNFCYGTTYSGGTNGRGTVFRFDTNGSFATVATFVTTNGYNPVSGVTRGADGALYGSTYNGPSGYSIIYRCTTNGVLTIANNESQLYGSVQYAGFTPGADQLLYSVTFNGAVNNAGTIIRLDTNGVASLLSTL
jgi:uncharacterized repeat protein (TIGR03803 family)